MTTHSRCAWTNEGGHVRIWVLDGLDRLDPDDQSALPWLPLNLPDGVQVVASALACSAREILIERSYTTLTIEPLTTAEQEQLIQRYLQRYTKELDGGLREQILNHPLAGSPLFLKVLLEELRQCGRHDTLQQQLAFYLSSQTVDDLYERVLERLENDGSGEAVRKVMTALWASRAGLTEPELLAITDLKPLQWAPIDLGLEKAFGRNGNRLVFDHDYLRIAVEDRYLGSHKKRESCHIDMIEYIRDFTKRRRDERYVGLPQDYDFESDPDSRFPAWQDRDDSVFGSPYADEAEIFWHLARANQWDELLSAFANASTLFSLLCQLGCREMAQIWHSIPGATPDELSNLVNSGIEIALGFCNSPSNGPIKAAEICEQLADFLDHMGVDSQRLRSIALDCIAKPGIDYYDRRILFDTTYKLSVCHRCKGEWHRHLDLLIQALETGLSNCLHLPASLTLLLCCELAVATCNIRAEVGSKIIDDVEEMWRRADNIALSSPDLLICCELLAHAYESIGNNEKAIKMLFKAHNLARQMHGECSGRVRRILLAIVSLYQRSGDTESALSVSKDLLIQMHSLPQEASVELLDVASLSARLAISAEHYDEARQVLENLFLRYVTSFDQNLASNLPGAPSLLLACLSNIKLIVERGDIEEASNRYLFGGLSHFVWNSSVHIEEVRIGDLSMKRNYQGDTCDSEISRRRYLRWKIGVWTRLLGVAHRETVNARLEMFRFYCHCNKYDDAYRELVRILLQESDRRKNDYLSVFNVAISWCKTQILVYASDLQVTHSLTTCAHYLQDVLDQISSNNIISPYKAHMKLLLLQYRSHEHAFLDNYRLGTDEDRGLNWVHDILSILVAPVVPADESERARLSFRHGSVMGGAELAKLLDAYVLWIEASGSAAILKDSDQNSGEIERLILAQVQRLLGSHNPSVPKAMVKFANAYAKTGQTDIAEECCSVLTSYCESILESGSRSALDVLHELSNLCIDLSHFDQAENTLRRWLAGREAAGFNPEDAFEVLRDHVDHPGMARQSNEGKKIIGRVCDLAREPNDYSSFDESQCSRAFALFLLTIGKSSESFAALQDFFRIRRKLYGPSDHDSLDILAEILDVLSAQGMHREGLALSRDAQQALAVDRDASDPKILAQIFFYQACLHEEIGEMEQAEDCYRQCLSGREAVLGFDHPDTMDAVYRLADILSAQQRPADAIPLRRRELAWCRQHNGDTDSGTLMSINQLAIDLRETGELEEAETLFRELVSARQQVLEPDDFQIGRALGGLAKTLEDAGKLQEALTFSHLALDHRHRYEGDTAWITNLERLDLARVLHRLNRTPEALTHLADLERSIQSIEDPDDDDRQLLEDARTLRHSIQAG